MKRDVIVLNSNYMPINCVGWKDAVNLIFRGIVEPVGNAVYNIRTVAEDYLLPKVVRLVKFVNVIYKHNLPYSKKHVLVRDGFKCQYCGRKHKNLTIDHVLPKSRGGKDEFLNTVAACSQCNSYKGDKLPEEINLPLIKKPTEPTIADFIFLRLKNAGTLEVLRDVFEQVSNS